MKIKAYIDRIEDNIAILLLGEDGKDCVNFPIKYLPKGSKEGIYITLDMKIDDAKTQSSVQEAQNLIDELTRRNVKG